MTDQSATGFTLTVIVIVLATTTYQVMTSENNSERLVSSVRRPTRIHCRLREELPRGTFVADIRSAVKSLLVSDHETVFVFLTHQHRKQFALDGRNGILSTLEVIDRDVICSHLASCVIEVRIGVVQTGSVRHFRLVVVAIEILDINDNRPMFTIGRTEIRLAESTSPGLLFPLPTADDPDSPPNAFVRYRIESETNTFGLYTVSSDNKSGNGSRNVMSSGSGPTLVLRKALDRERQDRYQLVIVADDNGDVDESKEDRYGIRSKQFNRLVVDIAVIDVNDNGPSFTKSIYSTTVSENQLVGDVVLTVRALDPDTVDNAQVRYYIMEDCSSVNNTNQSSHNASSFFLMNQLTGELTVSGIINYEQLPTDLPTDRRHISFCVAAYDASASAVESGVATATALVIVDVIDDVDSRGIRLQAHPTWRLERCNSTWWNLTENSYGENSRAVHDNVIKLVNVTVSSVNSECFVRQSGTVSSRSRCFRLEELNDSTSYQLVWTRHSSSRNSDCSKLEPTVVSLTCHVTTRGIVETYSAAINIDKATAKRLSTSDLTENVTFATENVELGSGTATGNTRSDDICIGEVMFDRGTFVFNVPENEPALKTIGHLTESTKLSGCFRYMLGDGPEGKLFGVGESDGILFALEPLDRETRRVYTFPVYAEVADYSYPVRVKSTNVTIRILDVNDNAPIFVKPSSRSENDTIYLTATLPAGYIVGSVQAIDFDEGENSRLSYSMSSAIISKSKILDESRFRIDSENGSIYVLSSTTDLEVDTWFRLSISANDHGTPSLSSVTSVLAVIVSSTATGKNAAASSVLPPSNDTMSASNSYPKLVPVVGIAVGLVVTVGLILVAAAAIILTRRCRQVKRDPLKEIVARVADQQANYEVVGISAPSSDKDSNYTTNVKTVSDIGLIQDGLIQSSVDSQQHDKSHTGNSKLSAFPSHMTVVSTETPRDLPCAQVNIKKSASIPRRGQLNDWLSSEGYHLRVTGNAYQVKRRQTLHDAATRWYNVPTRTVFHVDKPTETAVSSVKLVNRLVETATDV